MNHEILKKEGKIVLKANIFERSLFTSSNAIKSFNPTPLIVQEIDRFAKGTQNTLKNLIILSKERPPSTLFFSCPFLGSDPLKVFTRMTFFFVRFAVAKLFQGTHHTTS